MNAADLGVELRQRFVPLRADEVGERSTAELVPETLVEAVRWLVEQGAWLAGVIAEDTPTGIVLSYPFLPPEGGRWLMLQLPAGTMNPPSVVETVYAADWPEREIEDLFELHFAGHPQLGDFVLHNEEWPEGVAPMRRAFDARRPFPRVPNPGYRPPKLLHAAGAFSMTVGPIYSDIAEAVRFQLETVGEEVISAHTRLFYKYRALEKIAEGQEVSRALLLAERLNGTSAVAHALAFVQALETLAGCAVPPRAQRLRVLAAELERLRSHAATVSAICKSTGLSVPTNRAYSMLESLLRLSGEFFGHRYLFGYVVPGGVSLDFEDAALSELARRTHETAARLAQLGEELSFDNSFLDRLEEVGVIAPAEAASYGLVGPLGRASGRTGYDLRRRAPYAAYAELAPDEALESEGDGYARLRIFLAEAAVSARLIERVVQALPAGAIVAECGTREGAALGWSEAPGGAAVHWLRLDAQGRIACWRCLPPALVNWHGFHRTAENFAFQDFPITLATVGLSVAEADR